MSTTLREALARRADEAGAPELDVDALVELAERRLRRRQLGAVLASAAAVLVVIALVIGGASLVGPSKSTGPIDKPSPSPAPSDISSRSIVYRDGIHGGVIQFGDRVIRTGDVVHMTVTDDGVVYTKEWGYLRGRGVDEVRFDNGTDDTVIGRHLCVAHLSDRVVVAGTTGSLVAWADCSDALHQSFVVYDTGAGSSGDRGVVARISNACNYDNGGWEETCVLRGIVGDHVYVTHTAHVRHRHGAQSGPGWRTELIRYDVSTEHRSRVPEAVYGTDRRATPRGLVVGDSWETGTPTDGIGQSFRVSHGRLIPQRILSGGLEPADTAAFVTGSGRPLHLRLSARYAERFIPFNKEALRQVWRIDSLVLFEWLDDDTVALGVGVNGYDEPTGYNGDIVRCTVSTGRCELAVPGVNDVRTVPNLGLPG
jgi:hypothetical protein